MQNNIMEVLEFNMEYTVTTTFGDININYIITQ